MLISFSVGKHVAHHVTTGGSGSGIQCVTSAHHSQLPLMHSLSNTSVPSVAKTRTSSSGSRSLTGIHSPIASSRCVTQKQTQNVSFLMHFRYQKNRPCRKPAFAVCKLRPECHVFSQKNLPWRSHTEQAGTAEGQRRSAGFPAAAVVQCLALDGGSDCGDEGCDAGIQKSEVGCFAERVKRNPAGEKGICRSCGVSTKNILIKSRNGR